MSSQSEMATVCRAQAIGAWRLFGRLLKRDPLPKTLKGSAQAGVGCCLFPFASIIVWIFVLMVWTVAGMTLGSYAILMTLGWGIGSLLPHRKIKRTSEVPQPPPLS